MTDRELAGPQRSAWTPGSTVPRPEAARFRFTGSGSEYFRIWGLNLLLSVLTLGLYSAWAKVRREQYFHRNTQLAGSAFDYHGKPTAILKGRAIAVGGLALLQASSFVSPLLNAGLTLLLGLSVPWLIVRSLAFRLHNTSHRGLRFRFHGTTREALSLYFGYGVLNLLTLGLAFPAFYRAQTRFRFENAAFGATRFRFGAGLGRFYRLFGAALGLLFAVGGSLGAAVAMSGAFGALASSETAADSGEPAAVAAVAALMIYPSTPWMTVAAF